MEWDGEAKWGRQFGHGVLVDRRWEIFVGDIGEEKWSRSGRRSWGVGVGRVGEQR